MNNKKGFSLIELTFSLLIVGLGVLVIFQVFPLGTTEGKNSIGDARALEFSQNVFSKIREEVNGLSLNQWDSIVDDWDSRDVNEVFDPGLNIQIPNGSGNGGTYTINPVNTFQTPNNVLEYPKNSFPKEYLKYKLCYRFLDIDHYNDNFSNPGSLLMVVYLEVSYGKLITNHTKTFYTCIYYKANNTN